VTKNKKRKWLGYNFISALNGTWFGKGHLRLQISYQFIYTF